MFTFFKKKKALAATPPRSKQNPPSSSRVKRSLLALEPRLMFDAAAAATASDVASEQVAQEQAEAAVSSDSAADGRTTDEADSQGVLDAIATYNPGESRTEIVFVDPTVPNYQELLSAMDPNLEVIMLDGSQDGVEQMATTLSGRSGIDAIHLISHGSAGQLQLGTGTLNADSMSGEYADELATIQLSLSEQADILVYGCDFADGDTGQAAVNLLAELTGADVQASTDLTGNISLGGDWDFEVSTGTIETAVAIDYDTQMNWAGVLGNETVADIFSDKSFGNNDGTRSWSSNWSEADIGASEANGGHIKVNSGKLQIDAKVVGASVSRGVDLSSARSATLQFDYNNDFDKGGSVEVRVSTDGGANYRSLSEGTFSKTSHPGSGTASFDLSEHLSANTKIQFLVTGSGGGERLFVDNVRIDYHINTVNEAPTDLSVSANSATENAATEPAVGTVSGTDPDAGDTTTDSLTDTADETGSANLTSSVQESHNSFDAAPNTLTFNVTPVAEASTASSASSTVAESLVSSLFINAETTQSGASQTVELPSDHHNEVTEGESHLADDAPYAAETNTNPVSPVEPVTSGQDSPPDTHEQVLILGRDGPQAASTEIPAITEATDSSDSPDAPPQESGPWPWLQSDGIEAAQDESAGLGLSMAVGLSGMVWQGNQGTKKKLPSMNAQLQALHQKNLSENKSQEADEHEKKESAPED